MSNFLKLCFCVSLLALFSGACAGSGGFGDYLNTNQLTVDSTNDRLFISQPGGVLFALTASTQVAVAEQPIVDDVTTNTDISALLPRVITNFQAYANGTTSRLFIMGAITSGSALVLNEIRVLDFDGTSFTETPFSPIVISDGNDATDESDDSFGGLVVDQAGSVVYVTDTSGGFLFAFNATDGTELMAPVAIAGNPQGMALDNSHLYVCNSSSVDAEQVISVFNTADFSVTTIDAGVPCNRIQVASNATGTAMILKNSSRQQVLIQTVDTTTYAASSAISASTSGFAAGELSSGAGISSGINDIALSRDSSENLQAYLSEEDGNLEFVTIASDLSSYAIQTLSVSALNLSEGEVLTSGGFGATTFFVAESGALVTVDVGSTDVSLAN